LSGISFNFLIVAGHHLPNADLSDQVDNATEVSSAVIRALRGARALFDGALALDATLVF